MLAGALLTLPSGDAEADNHISAPTNTSARVATEWEKIGKYYYLNVYVSYTNPVNSSITANTVRYRIKDSGGGWSQNFQPTPGNDITVRFSNASGAPNKPGGTYEYQVAAGIGSNDWGAYSTLGTFTAAFVPAKPEKPTVARGNESVTLSASVGYNGGSSITKWRYAYKTTGDYGDWNDVANTTNSLSHTVTGLTNGTAYTFKAQAVNGAGNSEESDDSDAVTPATTPAKPSAPTLTHGDQQLAVSWSAPDDNGSAITDYDVQYSSDSGATWTEWNASDDSTTTSATITGLTNGTGYQVQVRATNGVGDSDWSDSATATPSDKPGKPTITAVIPTGGCIIVRWEAPARDGGSPITGYKVSDPGSGVEEDVVLGNIREKKWGNNNCTLLDSLSYGMQVKATNANGDGPWSDEVGQHPTKPVLTASSVTWATATLSISNHANAPWWYKGDQSGATCTKVAKGTASASISGLDGSTKYTYSAYYDANCPSASKHDDESFTTLATPTLDVTVSQDDTTAATLTIANHTGDWYYQASQGSGQGASSASNNASCQGPVNGNSVNLTGLTPGASYTYTAYSDSACQNQIAQASFIAPQSETAPGQTIPETNNPGTTNPGKTTGSSGVTGAITGDDDDDDLPAAIRPNPQSVTVVEGSAATYTVSLLRRPRAEVIVSLASDNAAVTVSPASLTFTEVRTGIRRRP